MRRMFIRTLSVILCAVCAAPAFAGWEYQGDYVGDGYYQEDGSRFVFSVRGGASYGFATIKNKIGAVSPIYVTDEDGNIVYCTEETCTNIVGVGELSDLPPKENFAAFAFAAGASIGFTMPNRPQWRLEAGWDHIAETDYNASPLFEGELTLNTGVILEESVGAIQSTVTTDVFSAMAIYDFYDGLVKPTNTFIPYFGAGIGYARAKTVTNLSDPYGALSLDGDLYNFGDVNEITGVLDFYRSETETGTFAALAAVGVSYGMTESIFFDAGLRVMYVPQVRWRLTNSDDTKHRDLISAEDMVYVNAMLGMRFEF